MYTLPEHDERGYRHVFDSLLFWGGVFGAQALYPKLAGSYINRPWLRAISVLNPEDRLARAYLSKGLLGTSTAEELVTRATRFSRQAIKTYRVVPNAGNRVKAALTLRRGTTGAYGAGVDALQTIGANLKKLGKIANLAFALDIGLTFGRMLGKALAEPQMVPVQVRYEVPRQSWAGGPAYTQRQRAIAAIHNSQLTTRAIFGNEAAYVH